MAHKETVLTFLQSIAPQRVTNSEIAARTGIKPHQTVFMITRDLMNEGVIQGRHVGKEWHFWRAEASPGDISLSSARLLDRPEPRRPLRSVSSTGSLTKT